MAGKRRYRVADQEGLRNIQAPLGIVRAVSGPGSSIQPALSVAITSAEATLAVNLRLVWLQFGVHGLHSERPPQIMQGAHRR